MVFSIFFSLQISTNAIMQIFVNTMERASIITAHIFVTVQMDGRDSIVKMVSEINLKIKHTFVSFKTTIKKVDCICIEDIDECQMLHLCKNNGTCLNTNGSYVCSCEEGWRGQHCEDGKLHV